MNKLTGKDEAVFNAVQPDKESFELGESFSDGNLVVGVSADHAAIALNNCENAKNSVVILQAQEFINLYATMTAAMRSQGWLHG
ncbi:MAG: hypothetical protein KGL39_53550 [Patescibacteria group bacterium]|nr:hypothetical protein [Patescibacteria group bacterium]